jgi:hypothetical protein
MNYLNSLNSMLHVLSVIQWVRNGFIPERKAGTRGYDWENGRLWSFDVETFRKVCLFLFSLTVYFLYFLSFFCLVLFALLAVWIIFSVQARSLPLPHEPCDPQLAFRLIPINP